jgi:hypothetical protein
VWDAQNGQLQGQLLVDGPCVHLTPLLKSNSSRKTDFTPTTTPTASPMISTSLGRHYLPEILRRPQQPLGEQSHTRQYDVDDSHEWVVSGSKRICWIPPGYIRSGEAGYCWAGSALVMVGQDETLRMLNFRS